MSRTLVNQILQHGQKQLLCIFHCKNLKFLFKKLPRYHILFQKADGFLKKVSTIVKTCTFPYHHNCALCLVREERVILNLQHISQGEMPYTEHSHPGRNLVFGTRVITFLLSRRAEVSSAFSDPSHFPHGDQQLHLMQQSYLNLLSKEQAKFL